MKYTHTREESLEVLRKAVPLMAQQPAALNPVHYAVWYEHVSGMNAHLSQELMSRLSARKVLTDADVLSLFESYVDINAPTTDDRLARAVASLLRGIVLTAESAGADLASFRESLEQRHQALEEPLEQMAIRALIDGLLDDTRRMRTVAGELAASLSHHVEEVANLQSRLKQAEADALVDALTGLRNRRAFDRDATAFIEDAGTLDGSALLFLDVDHFKRANDELGHLLADKVLCAVAQVVRSSIKGKDIAARIGGEEFAVLLPSTTLDGACALAEQIRTAVASGRIKKRDQELSGTVTVSIGVAQGLKDDTLDMLLERADRAMYEAKHTGRNRVCAASE